MVVIGLALSQLVYNNTNLLLFFFPSILEIIVSKFIYHENPVKKGRLPHYS